MKVFTSLVLISAMFFVLSCSQALNIAQDREGVYYEDNVYTGEYFERLTGAKVEVTVADGQITNIRIIDYRAGWDKDARTIIPERIIKEQTPRVDAVTGATSSSNVIMNAVQRALEQAVQR